MEINHGLVDELKKLKADVDARGKTIMLLEDQLDVLDGSHKDLAHRLADAGREIERLREYACHKWSCSVIGSAAAKCDCGLAELLGENYVEEIPNTGPIVPKLGR